MLTDTKPSLDGSSSTPESSTVSSCKHCYMVFSKDEDRVKHEEDHFDEEGMFKPISKGTGKGEEKTNILD